MIKKILFLIFFTFAGSISASNHGIYLLTVKNLKKVDINMVGNMLNKKVAEAGFTVYDYYDIATPEIMHKSLADQCNFKGKLIVFSSNNYVKMLTSYGEKYLAAAFLRIGIYETPNGIQVSIADPETINRIIFNDMWNAGKKAFYNEVIKKTKFFKNKIIKLTQSIPWGIKTETQMPPIRSDEDLAESSKDMFMLVGHMTFFTDEDQFPQIYSIKNTGGIAGILKLKAQMLQNIKNFKPTEDDSTYRYTKSPSVLKWKVVAEIFSPDSTALLLGITRPRTEALSFDIAGESRSDEKDKCPGIDHLAAYPIGVLVMQKGDKIIVRTPREMFRMDMYFWDAGMGAFMNHMQMPSMLDESIGRALFGKNYTND